MNEAYIVAAARTAGARRNGRLAQWHPADLGALILDALCERSGIDPDAIEDVLMGCVTQAGEQSTNLARNAVLASRLPESVPAVSIDRQCGSSQQALHFAAQAVMSGVQDVVIAAGTECMTRVPMGTNMTMAAQPGASVNPLSERIRAHYGVDAFSQFTGAEMIARNYGFARERLDQFALESHRRAIAAIDAGAFSAEIVPVPISAAVGDTLHVQDEGVRRDATLASIAAVNPLQEGGVITAANASQICDGASGVLVVNARALRTHRLEPLARIHAMTVSAGDPVIMLEEPIGATQRVLERAGLGLHDIDLYEVNEAFAPVPLAWLGALNADAARLNVHGGAIALGHPLGASGTKLMTTLIHALRSRKLRYGLQTMCEGGGMANATIIEAL